MSQYRTAWCTGGVDLVRILGERFGKERVVVRSEYHLQVKEDDDVHNIWLDAKNRVKYKLADHAGPAVEAVSLKVLLRALRAYDKEDTDLVNMREALELSQLIDQARAALPACEVPKAVFVDAGFKEGKARIGVVLVEVDDAGEHVSAEAHPCKADNINDAEAAAIDFALWWSAPEIPIFSDSQSAVSRYQGMHNDRIKWLPRKQNKIADSVANVRSKASTKSRSRKRKKKAKKAAK